MIGRSKNRKSESSERPERKRPSRWYRLGVGLYFAALGLAGAAVLLNLLVTGGARSRMFLTGAALAEVESGPEGFRIDNSDNGALLPKTDAILILGCGVWADGTPSPMLRDRLDQGIALYQAGVSDRILMSGDHGRADYDEVNAMRRYAMAAGVPSEAIFMDHAGFSTYDSVYRAKEIFGAEKLVIVSQTYHLYRAVWLAEGLGVEAYGVSASLRDYRKQEQYGFRELLARVKAVGERLGKPEPKLLGEPISLSGSGDVTNDEGE